MPNKALKVRSLRSLDVSSRRMLRILRAACSRPLALRYVSNGWSGFLDCKCIRSALGELVNE